MTIASHCIDLLRTNGPMTREELGEPCRVAGVTAAKDPALAVQGALLYDGRVLRVDGRYHLVERLLEGRWLTLERPDDPGRSTRTSTCAAWKAWPTGTGCRSPPAAA